MREDIRTVRFVGMQGTDELFRCIENKKVYIRRRYEEQYAEWLTTTSWSGGYEPDCHIRSGVSFRLVDRKGNEVFTEKVEQIPGYWYPYAVRKGPFYTDCLRDLSQKVAGKNDLHTYEEWRAWLMEFARKSGYDGYDDNWLYCEVEYEEPKKITEVTVLGERLILVSEKAKHTICKKSWVRYEIRNADMIGVAELCGFSFVGGYRHDHGK